MKPSETRVSVVMSVYNGEAYLRQAIDSILCQSFTDFEFLVIDDGSTDQTSAILHSYEDPRIRLLTNPKNVGLSQSLNRGLSEARGEFVARQDADDVSEPERLGRQVAFLDAHPEVALLGTWYTEIGGAQSRQRALPCDYAAIRWALLFFCPFVHSAVMWRRTLVSSSVGGYDESLRHSMDFELWARIADSFPVANLGEHLVRLRLHPESMTMTYGDHTLEGHRLRVGTVTRLLRWTERGVSPEEFEQRFLALDALARGVDNGSMPERALAALDDLFLLQAAFCEEAGVQADEHRVFRIALRRRIARNLARLARRERYRHGSFKTSLQLLSVASGLWAQSMVRAYLTPAQTH